MVGRSTEKAGKIFLFFSKLLKQNFLKNILVLWALFQREGKQNTVSPVVHSIPPDFLHPQPQSLIWSMVPTCSSFPAGCCMDIQCQVFLLCTGPLKSSEWKPSQWAWIPLWSLCCAEGGVWGSVATVMYVSAWEMGALGLRGFVFSWYRCPEVLLQDETLMFIFLKRPKDNCLCMLIIHYSSTRGKESCYLQWGQEKVGRMYLNVFPQSFGGNDIIKTWLYAPLL